MFKDRIILIHTILSLFLNQLVFWLIFLNLDRLPLQIPLWYLQPWGESQLANQFMIWLIPGIAITILTGNLVICAFIHRRYRSLTHFLMTTATVASFFLLLATLNLVSRVLGWI